MKLKTETVLKRFLNSFKTHLKEEQNFISVHCKSIIFRFKNAHRIEVISKYENNDIYFKPCR